MLTEARAREIIDNMSEALYAVDKNWRITYVNRKLEEVYGRRRQDLLGKVLWEEFPRLVESQVHEELLSAMRERRPVAFEYLTPTHQHWFDVRAYPIGAGQVVYFGDITERKQAEAEHERLLKELDASRRLFQRIAETSPDAVYVYDLATGRTVYFSAQSEQIIGYTAEQVSELGDRFAATHWHPDDLRGMPEHLSRLRGLANGEIYECEYRIHQPDDTYRWLRTRSSVFARADDGQVRQIIDVTQDVTERKRAAEALRALKDRLAADLSAMTHLHALGARLLATSELQPLLQDALDTSIAFLGADFGNIQLYNRQTDALEIIVQQGFGQAFLDHFSSVDGEHSAYGRALQRGERVIVEDVEADADFAPRRSIAAASGFRSVQATPLLDRAGELLGVFSTHFRQPHRFTEHELRLTDLYARQSAEMIGFKLAEQRLFRAHDELEARVAERTRELAERNERLRTEIAEREHAEQARQQLRQQIVGAQEAERRRISHELHDSLGQYLTALHLGLKLAQEQAVWPPHVADNVTKLRKLALAIDDAVDRLAFELRPPALDDLGLEAALHLLVREWSAISRIPADMHINELDHRRLPATIETTVYRIVQEALTNILKHTQATGVSLIVERRNGEVHAIVEDNGCGFDLENVMYAPDAQRKLGLRGMQERAALVGGQLDIETSPQAGTTIYLHIPLSSETGDGGPATDA